MANWDLKAADFTVFRTPYLSETTIDALSIRTSKKQQGNDIQQSLQELIRISNRKDIIQAIEFASPSLAAKISQLTNELTVDNLKLASSIYKYLTRMSTRSTPFGAFSSVMTVDNKEKTKINIDNSIRLFLRVDNGIVLELARLAQQQAIKSKNLSLLVRKNSSLYEIGDEIRFVSKVRTKDYVDFKLDEVKFSHAIGTALELAEQWISLKSLVAELGVKYDQVDSNKLTNFVHDLLNNQLLESNLGIVITSSNSFKELINRASESKVEQKFIKQLSRVDDLLTTLTALNDKQLKHKLSKARTILEQMLPAEFDMKHWIHVDSFRSGHGCSMGKDTINALNETVSNLADFFWRPNKVLTDFTNRFIGMYGEAEVSLLEALDIDNGIQFGRKRLGRSPLLNGVLSGEQNLSINVNWAPIDQFFMKKIVDGLCNNETAINIRSEELEKYKSFLPKTVRFDDSMSIHATVLQGEDEETLYKINSISGPSGIMLLGRFCCGDAEMARACKDFAAQEQENNPDIVYAEIIHIPQPRTANISCRPSLREKEIVYGPGDSNLTSANQINCSDLYLKVVAGRLLLFSKKLQKEVRPRLASAHNTSGLNLPIYQFLHSLQGSDGWFVGMTLNRAIETLQYIPEIRVDNLVLFERRWLINSIEIKKIQSGNTYEEKITLLNELLKDRNISRYVALSEGDNTLDFDLHSPFSALMFINEIKNKPVVNIIASIRGRSKNLGGDTQEAYRHEFVVPCFMTKSASQKTPTIDFNHKFVNIKDAKEMSSLPGEKWKYLKIYTGEASADKLIANYLAPLANKLKEDGKIERWFFIRYLDPDFHLRIRLKLVNEYQTDELNQLLYKPLKDLYKQGQIQKIVEDCYVPEFERYGGIHILEACEEIFYLNSVVVSELIKRTYLEPNKDDIRWKICLRLAWQLTMELCESFEQAEVFFKRIAASYDQEFNADAEIKKKLNHNYRGAMKEVSDCLAMEFDYSIESMMDVKFLTLYSNKLSNLKTLCVKHNQDVMAILPSIIHMDCNRIFVISPRANEWVIYHYLARYIRTVIARKFIANKDVAAEFLTANEKTDAERV
jgi:thiopeptide-type bacteriocin biosynthesis protein